MVAITDHHDICFAEYVRSVAQQDQDFLFFPGIEITCSDNTQCLLILDPSCGPDFHAKILGTLTNVMPAHSDDEKTCLVAPIPETISAFYEKVLKDELLRERCLVFPHFSNPDHSHKSLNEVGHAHRFAELGCDGIYIERPIAELDDVTKQKIRGEIADWGKRRRAIIPTGDNRSEGWERLGTHDCWIKIGESTIEGLRQALLADEARVSHVAPQEPVDRLYSLTIKSTICGPEPMVIRFNPGFNAIIGGRGSGKSAILEYLRFGLGRTANDLPNVESGRQKERSANLIEETLADDGFVEIKLERNGIAETWRRELASRQKISVTDVVGTVSAITLGDAQQKFPARAFDQKGLSSTMVDPSSAADQITGIAAAEEVEQRRAIDQDISSAKRSVTLALQQLAAYWQLQIECQSKGTIAHETQIRATNISEKLKTEGVSEEAIAVIDQAPIYASGASYIQSVEAAMASTRGTIGALSSKIITVADEATLPNDLQFIVALKTEVLEARLRIAQRLQECVAEIAELEIKKDAAKVQFGAARQEYKTRYDAAVIEQEKHKAIIGENARITGALALAKKAHHEAEQSMQEAAPAVDALEQARRALADRLLRRREILANAAAKVAGHSSETLKARVKVEPAPEEYVNSLAALLAGSRVSDAVDKCKDWVTDALAANQDGAWRSICDQIIEIYSDKVMAGSPTEPGKAILDKIAGFMLGGAAKITPFAANRVYQLLNDELVGNVISARSRDFIVLTYVDAEGRAIQFARASEGQQASALLELLLRQSAGTLIIDQPEDDLDNNVVMKIVDLIRTSKSHRQLIFATHNPNVVVNGDADKILALASTVPDPRPNASNVRIVIDTDGAIETPDVKKAITHIMEGGAKAFDLRRRKYRFDKDAE
jgi:chromosome segregation protein